MEVFAHGLIALVHAFDDSKKLLADAAFICCESSRQFAYTLMVDKNSSRGSKEFLRFKEFEIINSLEYDIII